MLSAISSGAAYTQNGPQIKFVNQDSVFDYGVIHEEETPQYQFEIKNSGHEGLTITDIKTDNKNLAFRWPHKILKPGKKALIVATYYPRDGIGSFKNEVFFTSNATGKPYPFIHISGTVLPQKDNTPSGSGGSSKKRGKGR